MLGGLDGSLPDPHLNCRLELPEHRETAEGHGRQQDFRHGRRPQTLCRRDSGARQVPIAPHSPQLERPSGLDAHTDNTAPETTPTASSSRSRDTPNSPRPRLFDNLPLPEGPVASDVLSEADYRRLRSNAFRPSVIAGPLLISSALGEPSNPMSV